MNRLLSFSVALLPMACGTWFSAFAMDLLPPPFPKIQTYAEACKDYQSQLDHLTPPAKVAHKDLVEALEDFPVRPASVKKSAEEAAEALGNPGTEWTEEAFNPIFAKLVRSTPPCGLFRRYEIWKTLIADPKSGQPEKDLLLQQIEENVEGIDMATRPLIQVRLLEAAVAAKWWILSNSQKAALDDIHTAIDQFKSSRSKDSDETEIVPHTPQFIQRVASDFRAELEWSKRIDQLVLKLVSDLKTKPEARK